MNLLKKKCTWAKFNKQWFGMKLKMKENLLETVENKNKCFYCQHSCLDKVFSDAKCMQKDLTW